MSRKGDGHGVTEKEREGKESEREVVDDTTVREEIRSGLEESEDKATERRYRKEEKV